MFHIDHKSGSVSFFKKNVFLDFWSPEISQRGMEGVDQEGRPAEPQSGDGEVVDDGAGLPEIGITAGV